MKVYDWDTVESSWEMRGTVINHSDIGSASLSNDGLKLLVRFGHSTIKSKVVIYAWSDTNSSWDVLGTIEEPSSSLGRYIANISKNGKSFAVGGQYSSDVEVYQIGELVLEQTPTPTQEELPSSISPSMWTDDEMLAQFNSSALPKYCAISMYAKDGKYYIASGTNKVGEPQSFEKAPITIGIYAMSVLTKIIHKFFYRLMYMKTKKQRILLV